MSVSKDGEADGKWVYSSKTMEVKTFSCLNLKRERDKQVIKRMIGLWR